MNSSRLPGEGHLSAKPTNEMVRRLIALLLSKDRGDSFLQGGSSICSPNDVPHLATENGLQGPTDLSGKVRAQLIMADAPECPEQITS